MTHLVEVFWSRLLEFASAEYPDTAQPVNACLRGTAFFSGGAGLYIEDPYGPLPPFPHGGVMVIGNNLDAADSFAKRVSSGQPHGDPISPMKTWRHLYWLLEQAGIVPAECFFTNVFVGLVRGPNPSAGIKTSRRDAYWRWCAEFLELQVDEMQPRAGSYARRGRQAVPQRAGG